MSQDAGESSARASPRPAHVDESVRVLADLHTEHYERLSPLGRALDRVTAALGEPWFVIALVIAIIGWIAFNVVLRASGHKAIDPPPFNYLQGAGTLFALGMTCLILSTQRRENEILTRRDQLTLELSLLAEQKASKTIELLEELRRDSPLLHERTDESAETLSTPSDPRMVLEALQESPIDLARAKVD